MSQKKAVVLLSGGVDSATVAALAKERGFDLYCLTFDYGQRHGAEIAAARKIAAGLGASRHLVVGMDMRAIGGSALTNDAIPVPKNRSEADIFAAIPTTYVPARNTIFLAYALAYAEVLETGHIFLGVNAVDYSGYPDCRPDYIAAFSAMANLACKASVSGNITYEIHTPIMEMNKAQILQEGTRLGLDYSATVSCYEATPAGLACGECDACSLRRKGFLAAGLPDPTRYRG